MFIQAACYTVFSNPWSPAQWVISPSALSSAWFVRFSNRSQASDQRPPVVVWPPISLTLDPSLCHWCLPGWLQSCVARTVLICTAVLSNKLLIPRGCGLRRCSWLFALHHRWKDLVHSGILYSWGLPRKVEKGQKHWREDLWIQACGCGMPFWPWMTPVAGPWRSPISEHKKLKYGQGTLDQCLDELLCRFAFAKHALQLEQSHLTGTQNKTVRVRAASCHDSCKKIRTTGSQAVSYVSFRFWRANVLYFSSTSTLDKSGLAMNVFSILNLSDVHNWGQSQWH